MSLAIERSRDKGDFRHVGADSTVRKDVNGPRFATLRPSRSEEPLVEFFIYCRDKPDTDAILE